MLFVLGYTLKLGNSANLQNGKLEVTMAKSIGSKSLALAS